MWLYVSAKMADCRLARAVDHLTYRDRQFYKHLNKFVIYLVFTKGRGCWIVVYGQCGPHFHKIQLGFEPMVL